MKKIIFVIVVLLLPILLKAQYGDNYISDIGVKSLRIGGKYTKQQVVSAMGVQPTSYRVFPNDDNIGINESYRFGVNRLYFVEGGILAGFVIKSAQYPVFEQYKGGIRVGDPITRLHNLHIPGMNLYSSNSNTYEFGAGDFVVKFKVNIFGLITHISFSDPT